MNSFPALANVFPVKSPDPDFTICMWSCMMGGNGHFPPTCNSWAPYGIPDRAAVYTESVSPEPGRFSFTQIKRRGTFLYNFCAVCIGK